VELQDSLGSLTEAAVSFGVRGAFDREIQLLHSAVQSDETPQLGSSRVVGRIDPGTRVQSGMFAVGCDSHAYYQLFTRDGKHGFIREDQLAEADDYLKGGYLMASAQGRPVKLYHEPSLSTKVVAIIDDLKALHVEDYALAPDGDYWYFVMTPDGSEGFIQAADAREERVTR
jgi:hypothetical protein